MTSAVPLRGSFAFHLAQPRACLALLVLSLALTGAATDAARQLAGFAVVAPADPDIATGELLLLFPFIAQPVLHGLLAP